MKKLALIVVLLAAAGGGTYAVLGGHTTLYQTDQHHLVRKTRRFFECIKFKDFAGAAAFHNAEDQRQADIPKLIENLFKIPPEQLDIQEVNVLYAEVDSSGILAKTKTRCVVQVLNADRLRKPEVILYWKKEGGHWYLKLRSSLRKVPVE